jgi:hypothetical protein
MTARMSFTKTVDSMLPLIGANGVPNPATDPVGTYNYVNARRGVIQGAANQKPLIRLADNNLRILCALTEELSCTVEELMADSGQAKIVIRYDHWLENYVINGITINQDLHLLIDPIPSHPTVQGIPQDWQIRWGGKVKEISLVNHDDGSSTIEMLALSHREHTKRLLFGANPIFPPEIQIPKMWVLPGPTRSILFATGFINLARLFLPGLSAITNAFNPASWINPLNPDALLNINPMSWPIQVAFVDPALDTSMWGVLAATWTDWHSTMADLLSSAGCICRAYTWLTTDATSPHTELTDLITGGGDIINLLLGSLGLSTGNNLVNAAQGALENLTRPTRNCVVLSFEDKSGINGPTGTALDGLLELVGITLDDLITTVVFDSQTGQSINGEPLIDVNSTTSLFQGLLGVKTNPPKVIWRDGQFTGLVNRRVTMHKGPPLTIMTGGKSPALVNQLQTFGIRYALSELSDAINPGPPVVVGAPIQAPLVTGIENIYQGQLDNCLTPNSLVALDNAISKPIQDVMVGDTVLDHCGQPRLVTQTMSRLVDEDIVCIRYGADELRMTANHPVLVHGGNFVEAGQLHVGDWVCKVPEQIWLPIQAIETVRYAGPVYNLEVADTHTYVANGIAVHNYLLAWERYTDPLRALWTGELAYQEYIERGSGSAYTVAAFFSLTEGHWKTRPFYGFEAKYLNGRPWVYGVDFQLGDRVGFEMDGVIYVDQLAAAKYQYDRKQPVFLEISVGDDKDKRDPIAQGLHILQGVYALVGAYLGEGTLFG